MHLKNYLIYYNMFLINIRINRYMIKVLENDGTLKSAPDFFKNQEMCNKVVDNYPYGLEFFPECYKTQKISDKVANTYPSTIKFVLECFMTQKICDKAVN